MHYNIIDRGYDKYKSSNDELNAKEVAAGLFADLGIDKIEAAIANEMGTNKAGRSRNVTIPERPFTRNTFNKVKKTVIKDFRQIAEHQSSGKININEKLAEIGKYVEMEIKKTITEFTVPPNAPATIKKKGRNDPLVWDGTMRKDVTSKVRNKQ